MYKIITCPQCGQRLCRVDLGSKVEITCTKCKTDYEWFVDKDGSIHALPLDDNAVQKKGTV